MSRREIRYLYVEAEQLEILIRDHKHKLHELDRLVKSQGWVLLVEEIQKFINSANNEFSKPMITPTDVAKHNQRSGAFSSFRSVLEMPAAMVSRIEGDIKVESNKLKSKGINYE